MAAADSAGRGLAKVIRPQLYAAYPRERLYGMLDGLRRHPVICVSAPPGAGKTTLLAGYAQARGATALWMQLDRGDEDPATFFYYLRGAAVASLPRRRLGLPLLTAEVRADLAGFTRRWFRKLFQALPPGALLVFDNYQSIGAEAALHAILRDAAEELGAEANLVLISRDEPPPAFAGLLAQQRLARLSWDDLRLTDEEACAVAIAAQPDIDVAVMRGLLSHCEGWAAGVVLMLERYRQTGAVQHIGRGETMESVFNYFAGLIFEQVSVADRDTLMRAAYLPHPTPAIVESLTGDPNAARLLETLYQRHLFTDRRLTAELSYHFHALFRAFLLDQAKRCYSEAERDAIARNAATLLAEDGQWDAAVELLEQARDWDALAFLACRAAPSLIAQGRHELLLRWIDAIPASRVEHDAWVSYWQGHALLAVDPARSEAACARAFRLFGLSGDRCGRLLSWARVVQAIRFDPQGNLYKLDHWIDVADDLLRDDDTFPSEDAEYPFVYGMYVALQHRRPRHPHYERWRDRAVALGLSSTDAGQRVYLAYLAVSYETQLGHLLQAKLLLDTADRVRGLSALTESFSYLGRIIYQVEAGELQGALATMRKGLARSQETGIVTWASFLRFHGGRAAVMGGDLAEAERLRDEMALLSEVTRGTPGTYYHHLSAWIALRRGDLSVAARHASLAVDLCSASGWLVTHARCLHLRARVAQAQGDAAKAALDLVAMQDLAVALDNRVLHCQAALLEALLAPEASLGAPALARGWKLARELNLRHTLWLLPEDGSVLCALALQLGIEARFVGDVVRALAVEPLDDAPDAWPWPVKVRALGGFELEVQSEPVVFTRKVPKRVIGLLKALIATGGDAVRIEWLSDALWPELDGDAAHQALEAALYRLRRVLGLPEAVRLHGGAVTLDARRCWIDVRTFERMCARAEASDPNSEQASDAAERAIALYRGPLLPTEEAEAWSRPARERLRARFVHLVTSVAERLERSGNHDAAVAGYLRATEVDPLAEDLYQALMRRHLDADRCAEGRAVYQLLCRALATTAYFEPSAASQALGRKLGA